MSVEAKCIDDHEIKISLVENSGIQFLDYEITVDWDNRAGDSTIEGFKYGYFKTRSSSDSCTHYIRLVPDPDHGELFFNPLISDDVPREVIDNGDSIETSESLTLYNGVWFPIPYYAGGEDINYGQEYGFVVGPLNWARCRIVKMPLENPELMGKNCRRYHITLAFDTKTQNNSDTDYFAPSHLDAQNSRVFSLCWQQAASDLLIPNDSGISFVSNWAEAVFSDLGKIVIENYSDNQEFKRALEKREFEKHYLNVVAFLGGVVKPNPIRIVVSRGNINSPVDVSLILDVGNSRTYGALVEENSQTQSSDIFSDIEVLQLRDLNAVENIYKDAFSSCVEFQSANFDYDNCSSKSGRTDAFVWPSLVRVGHEAVRLGSHCLGSDGHTGLNSPKRYLWQISADSNSDFEWQFNRYSYQIPYEKPGRRLRDKKTIEYFSFDNLSTHAYDKSVNEYISSLGEARFASKSNRNMLANYSCKSLMTFMLMEIILQAMGQMNSFTHRNNHHSSCDIPRRLKSIVLTTPPSMPESEREIFRSCAYQAVGILWKSLGYDPTPADEFKFIEKQEQMEPKPPEIILEWDEAQAAQVVYLYNETQTAFEGDCKRFIDFIRRPDANGRLNEILKREDYLGDHDLASARIASIDIGGGTTDLIISDYAFPKDSASQTSDMSVREILREGFKIAGDDVLHDIIKTEILNPLKDFITVQLGKSGISADSILYDIVGRGISDQSVNFQNLRRQLVHQIFMKVGYRIISHLEALSRLPRGVTSVRLKGSIEDFILGKEQVTVPQVALSEKEAKAYKLPDSDILEFVNNKIKKCNPNLNFDILKFTLDIDLFALNRKFVTGGALNICKLIDNLCAIVNVYRCDILLLTGRPTSIAGIRSRILGMLPLSPNRIITMRSYRCGAWYPLTHDGDCIGDPKSTVVVGALLSYLKRDGRSTLMHFRFNPEIGRLPSPIRYVGPLNSKDMLDNENLIYMATSAAEDNKDGYEPLKSEIEDIDLRRVKKSNEDFSDDSFNVNLPIKLGYRQFDNPNYPASMLYCIEPYLKVEDLQIVKDAQKLYPDFSSGLTEIEDYIAALYDGKSQQLCRQAVVSFKEKCANIENSSEYLSFKELCENNYEQAKTQLIQESQQPEKGFFSKLFAKKQDPLELVDKNRLSSIYDDCVNVPLSIKRDELLKFYENEYRQSLLKARQENFKVVKDEFSARLKDLSLLVSAREHAIFAINLSLGVVKAQNDPVAASLDFLKAELGAKNLPSIITFGLKDVKDLKYKRNWKALVNLRLKTISEDGEYWINSGLLIDRT